MVSKRNNVCMYIAMVQIVQFVDVKILNNWMERERESNFGVTWMLHLDIAVHSNTCNVFKKSSPFYTQKI